MASKIIIIVVLLIFTILSLTIYKQYFINYPSNVTVVLPDNDTTKVIENREKSITGSDTQNIFEYINDIYQKNLNYTNLILTIFIFLLGTGFIKQQLDKKEIEKSISQSFEKTEKEIERIKDEIQILYKSQSTVFTEQKKTNLDYCRIIINKLKSDSIADQKNALRKIITIEDITGILKSEDLLSIVEKNIKLLEESSNIEIKTLSLEAQYFLYNTDKIKRKIIAQELKKLINTQRDDGYNMVLKRINELKDFFPEFEELLLEQDSMS